MRSLLFLLQTYAEVDHIAPLIWKCLERGQRALARPSGWPGGTPSSALIRCADVTIAAESSVTIEVLPRGKHLIHVSHLAEDTALSARVRRTT